MSTQKKPVISFVDSQKSPTQQRTTREVEGLIFISLAATPPDFAAVHAEFAPALDRSGIQHVVPKGTDPHIDSYSGFFDNARRRATGLASYLTSKGVDTIHVMGLATDYCVKAAAMDSIDLGFRTVLLTAGIRGVELQPGDCQRAMDEMRAAGVVIASGGIA